MWRAFLLCLALACIAGQGAAQSVLQPVPKATVLVVEFERLVNGSQAGRRILSELEDARQALVAENERIQQDLTEEERDLTQKRVDLPTDEFRALAEAFDAKVTAIRASQDEKARVLTQEVEQRQQDFLQTVRPLLAQIMAEAGASVLIERGTVLMVEDSVNITDLAIQRIDAVLGEGTPDQ